MGLKSLALLFIASCVVRTVGQPLVIITRAIVAEYNRAASPGTCQRANQVSANVAFIENRLVGTCETKQDFIDFNFGRPVNKTIHNSPESFNCLCYTSCAGTSGQTAIGMEYYTGGLDSSNQCTGTLVVSNELTAGPCVTRTGTNFDYQYTIDCRATDPPTSSPTPGPTDTPSRAPTQTNPPTTAPTTTTGQPSAPPTPGPSASPTPGPTPGPSANPTPAPTSPPIMSGVGDPHWLSADGVMFTFNGLGVYRFVEAPELDLEVQVKTHVAGNQSTAIRGLGVRLGNDLMTAIWNGSNSDQVIVAYADSAKSNPRVLGHEVFPSAERTLGNWNAEQTSPNVNTKTVKLSHAKHSDLVLELTFMGRSSFSLRIPPSARNTRGLVGTRDGHPENDLQSADGSVVLNPRTASMSDVYSVAETWKVPSATTFFDLDILPLETCPDHFRAFMGAPNGVLHRPEFENEELARAAEQICGSDETAAPQCWYDLAATGSINYARATFYDTSLMMPHVSVRDVGLLRH